MKDLGRYPHRHEDDDTFDVVLQKLSLAPPHVRRVFHAVATALIDDLDLYTVRGFTEGATTTQALVLHRDQHHVLGVDLQAGILVSVDHADARRFSLEEVWCRSDDASNRFLGEQLLDGATLPILTEADFVAEFMRAMNAREEREDAVHAAMRAAQTSAEPAPQDAVRGLLDHPDVPDVLRREVERAIGAGSAALVAHRSVARFDIAAAISAVASESVNPDVRFLMERIAGRYLFATPVASTTDTVGTHAPDALVASA